MQYHHQQIQNKATNRTILLVVPTLSIQENIGSLFRLAEAMGVSKIYFEQAFKANNRKIKKVSRTTVRELEYKTNIDIALQLKQFIQQKHQVLALEITSKSKPLEQLNIDKEKSIVWVLGNEQTGISDEILKLCPRHIHIHMYGKNTSMNVIHATAMALFQTNLLLNKMNE